MAYKKPCSEQEEDLLYYDFIVRINRMIPKTKQCLPILQSLYPSTMLCLNDEIWPVGYPSIYFFNIPKIEDMLPCSLLKGVFLPPKRYYELLRTSKKCEFLNIFKPASPDTGAEDQRQGYFRPM